MERIKIVQYGVTHEHAAGKIASLRKLTDIFEIVGVIDDRASTAARFPQKVDMSLYDGLNFITPEEFFQIIQHRNEIQKMLFYLHKMSFAKKRKCRRFPRHFLSV